MTAPAAHILRYGHRTELHNPQPRISIHRDIATRLTHTGHLTISDDLMIYRFTMDNGTWTYRVTGIDGERKLIHLALPD